MLRRTCMLLALCLSLAAPAHAQTLITEIQNTYEKIHSIQARFTQALTHKESGSVENRTGTLHFTKPLLVRWETAKPHAETLVITAKEIWDYLPDEEIVYKYPPQLVQDSRSLIQVVTGQARLDKDFDVKEEGEEGGLLKLRLYPKDPAPQMVEALMWVDPKTKLIRKASIIDFYANTNHIAFTEIQPNATMPKNIFSFTPPKGVEVEDRTDNKVEERELFK